MNDTDKYTSQQKRERQIAQSTLIDYQIYATLAEREKDSAFEEVFSELAYIAKDSFNFWGRKANVRGDEVARPVYVFMSILVRYVIGAERTARYIVHRTKRSIERYRVSCPNCLTEKEIKEIRAMTTRSVAVIDVLKRHE